MDRIESLLAWLSENRIRYLVIGANAMAVHGYVRATADLDLFVDSAQRNLERLKEALQEYGYDVTDASVDDFGRYKILLRQYDLPLDLHPFVKGVTTFAELWARRKTVKLGKANVHFASLDDLLRMKKAAGRPKDLEDLKSLRALKASTRKRSKKK